jgi:hypothetical protein
MIMSTIRILVKTLGRGLGRDANVYYQLIKRNFPSQTVVVVVTGMNDDEYAIEARYSFAYINLYLEHVLDYEKQWYPSMYKLLMVNQEMIYEYDAHAFAHIDKFLCKTCAAVDVLVNFDLVSNSIFERVDHKRIVYTYLTTNRFHPRGNVNAHRQHKNMNSILHLVSNKQWKNSISVIKAWFKLGALTTGWTIFITGASLLKYIPKDIVGIDVNSYCGIPIENSNCKQYNNLYYSQHPLTGATLHSLWGVFAYCIAPSYNEGWSHTINDARCRGIVTLTLDAPPMHEIGRSGILVPSRRTKLSLNNWIITDDAWEPINLSDGIMQILKCTPLEYNVMSINLRADYEADTLYFERSTCSALLDMFM